MALQNYFQTVVSSYQPARNFLTIPTAPPTSPKTPSRALTRHFRVRRISASTATLIRALTRFPLHAHVISDVNPTLCVRRACCCAPYVRRLAIVDPRAPFCSLAPRVHRSAIVRPRAPFCSLAPRMCRSAIVGLPPSLLLCTTPLAVIVRCWHHPAPCWR